MREILFRGKTVSGKKWIEGYFFHSIEEEHPRIMTVIHDGGNCFDEPPSDHEEALEVIPETVGQYIGLKDSDGNSIFEGDIVEFTPDKHLYKIVFDDGTFYGDLISDKGYIPAFTLPRSGKIIGNIHSNQELLNKDYSSLKG